MTTPAAIIAAAVTKVASLALARDGSKRFLAHTTGQPFASAAVAKKEAFEIVLRDQRFTNAWGIAKTRETQATLVVRLGTPPFSKEQEREKYLNNDIMRIADALEKTDWFPTDTQACFFGIPNQPDIDKTDPNWWLTEIYFNIYWLQVFPS